MSSVISDKIKSRSRIIRKTTLAKRILFLATGLNRGGAEMQVFHLAQGLQARGWDAQVVSLLDGGAMAGEFRMARIPLHHLSMERGVPDVRGILRLRKIIRTFRPILSIATWSMPTC